MEFLAILIIVGLYFLIWFATSGQDWLAKRRFNKLPEIERKSIEEAKRAEEWARIGEWSKKVHEWKEKERATWSEEKRKRERQKEERKRKHEFEILQSIERRNRRYSDKWFLIRQDVFKRDKNMCVFCGKDVKYVGHVHHKIPLEKGGDNSLENLQLLCFECHKKIHPWL
jgi:5-methylcytosine-specific restriction endonuclease McrA